MFDLLIELITGAILGLIISTTSIGGGVLVLPVLSYLFGLNALEAVATANFFSMLVKIPSSVMHYRLGHIPARSSLLFFIFMMPGTLLFSFLISKLAANPLWHTQVQYGLTILIVLATLFSLYLYCCRLSTTKQQHHTGQSFHKIIVPAMMTGALIGATGIGGSVIMLPLLIRYAGMSIKQAIGCSVFITMLLSGGAAWTYSYGHYTDLPLAIILFSGSLFSIPLSRYLLIKLSERVFQIMSFYLILGSALLMLYRLV